MKLKDLFKKKRTKEQVTSDDKEQVKEQVTSDKDYFFTGLTVSFDLSPGNGSFPLISSIIRTSIVEAIVKDSKGTIEENDLTVSIIKTGNKEASLMIHLTDGEIDSQNHSLLQYKSYDNDSPSWLYCVYNNIGYTFRGKIKDIDPRGKKIFDDICAKNYNLYSVLTDVAITEGLIFYRLFAGLESRK